MDLSVSICDDALLVRTFDSDASREKAVLLCYAMNLQVTVLSTMPAMDVSRAYW